jgi:endonuclease YncB( thermonuclease family)
MNFTRWLPAFLIVLLPLSAQSEEFSGRVVGVIDGDTLRVSSAEGKSVRVRLYGIDCPEKDQEYGNEARRLALKLAHGKVVLIKSRGLGRYGRTIGDVILPGGQNLNRELVRAGACWWYRRYAEGNEALADAEAEAKKEERGLWAGQGPVPPWKWRKRKRRRIR